MTYRVLDLGCGGGGVSTGYHRAGFVTVGVDIEPQPHYPYEFHQGDALNVLQSIAEADPFYPSWMTHFDLIHASMPCQRWSKQVRCRPELRELYPDLITPIRPLLQATGIPYVLENVEGAPLEAPITLCCAMFGREMYRHRLLETGNGIALPQPRHPAHVVRASRAGHWEPGTFFSMSGHVAPMWKAREVMDIDWLPREDLAEAIPPYMVEWAGLQVRAQLLAAA